MLLFAALPAAMLAVARGDGRVFRSASSWRVASNTAAGGQPRANRTVQAAEGVSGPVTAEETQAWLAGGNKRDVLWIDARPAAAFERGHVPGAVLLNEDEWSARLPDALGRWNAGTRVVVYCDGGDCHASERVAARLRDAGIAPVDVLRGGWPAWQQAVGVK